MTDATEHHGDDRMGERMLLANERVRVWQDHVRPGDAQPVHTHRNPYLSVVVRGAHGQIVDAEGAVLYDMDRTPGEVAYFGPNRVPVAHALRNVGDEDIEVVVVELLG